MAVVLSSESSVDEEIVRLQHALYYGTTPRYVGWMAGKVHRYPAVLRSYDADDAEAIKLRGLGKRNIGRRSDGPVPHPPYHLEEVNVDRIDL